jgi:DNA polymerase
LPQPITTMAIFHPAYLLRQPAKKKDTWFDLIKIQQFIEETI